MVSAVVGSTEILLSTSPTVIAVLTPCQSQLQEFETTHTVSNGSGSFLFTVRR